MSKFGPADEPYDCDRVHVIHRTAKQRRRRWKKVGRWGASGRWPKKNPNWLVIKRNHGGGGGP